jgi:hypothetical protein
VGAAAGVWAAGGDSAPPPDVDVAAGVGGGDVASPVDEADGDAVADADGLGAAVREAVADAVGEAEGLGEAECRTVVVVEWTGAAVAEWCGFGCGAGVRVVAAGIAATPR